MTEDVLAALPELSLQNSGTVGGIGVGARYYSVQGFALFKIPDRLVPADETGARYQPDIT